MKKRFNIFNGECLEVMKKMESESIDVCVTSPPYWKMRDYENEKQLGQEENYTEYIDKLIEVFEEVKRVLTREGSLWVNIADVYSNSNSIGVRKHSLIGLPERFKIKMIENGWICRNEIIWHKPNAMPSSAKTRFNNDYEKFFFFTKDEEYYFETQYEERKTSKQQNTFKISGNKTKYKNSEQEKQVRQGMNKERGTKIIEVRKNLPTQSELVDFLRERTSIKQIAENTNIKKSKIEHWFRRDKKGFSYPSIEDWKEIEFLINDFSSEFEEINFKINDVTYETDDVNKNQDKGRIKRAVWSINTKPSKIKHFAPYPEELIETPIKACCPKNGIVLDCFAGSGTTGRVAIKNDCYFVGIELNEEYSKIAKKRIEEIIG